MKTVIIILAAIIILLLGVLIFANPVKSPTATKNGPMVVVSPRVGDAISSPVAITGTLSGGGWFFEGVFPVKVVDGDGTVLGQGQAQAQPAESWMSTGTVSWAANISFVKPHGSSGTILLQNDNPSGLPQNAKSVSVPIVFAAHP